MKKYIIASLLAGAAVVGFSSCDDDRDSNPTMTVPSTFTLNTPALAGNVYDLANCNGIELSCSQPDFGYTAAVNYYTQLSLSNEWTNTLDENGEVVGNPKYVQLESYSTQAKFNVSVPDFNKAIMRMGGYAAEADVPANIDVYVRLNGVLGSGQSVVSNSVTLSVKPYFQALVSADPELWYLIGGCVGDGSWGGEIGVAIFPLSPVDGGKFDDATGKGPLTYTGYFPNDKGFKIIRTPGVWDENEWGGIDGDINNPHLKATDNESGSDFKVPTSGYYRIDLDTYQNTLVITAVDAPKEYGQMELAGDFNGWATDAVYMTPVDTYEGAIPHVWMYDFQTDTDTTLKFLVDSSWNPNWGSTDFPFGYGTGGGPNIPVPAGSYRIIFNDITGYYYFYDK